MEIEQQSLPFGETADDVVDQLAALQGRLETMYEHLLPRESPCGCTGPMYPAPVLEASTLGGLARLVTALVGVMAAARDVKELVEQHTIRAMPDRQAVADGYVLERRSGTVRKSWDHPLLASVISRLATVDHDSGEILMKAEDAQRVTDEIMACAGLAYWKVGELRQRGIDPGQYCEESRGRPSLIVRAPE